MVSQKFLGTLLMVVLVESILVGSSQAYKFLVGGRDGWVLRPSESYSHWAERLRFQVNDTLYFKYKKGSDSVLVVNKDDYYSCNTKNPSKSFTDGDSTFTFDRSGPFFFISGTADHCQRGQKLIIVVISPWHKKTTPPPPPPPSPHSPSPTPPVQPPRRSPPPVHAPAPAPSKAVSQRAVSGSALGAGFGCFVLLHCLVALSLWFSLF